MSSSRDIYGPHAMRFSLSARILFGFLAVIGTAAAGFGVADRLGDQGRARSDRLRGCTSSIATELVSGPQAVALKALAIDGVNSPEFRDAVDDLQPDRYKKLTRLALSDPPAFLEECERITKDGHDGGR